MPAKKKEPKPKKQQSSRRNHIQEEKKFYTVGIGASAGGLAAFEQFFAKMPLDSGIAFVLVSHLDRTHISILPELIQKFTKIKVFQIEDGMRVQPNCVYVIPPNKDVAILNKTLQLIDFSGERGFRMPIDTFFRSLAEDQKEKAVGVILSGMGTDGTLGLKTIKGELGLIMVQEPESAQSDSMPKSAIETNLVDYILTPEKMPEALIKYTKSSISKVVQKMPAIEGDIPNALQKIFLLLRSNTGHDFSLYKQNTISRRIERRMSIHHIEDISRYVRYLQQTPHEIQILFKELLIGVTNFFRDPEAFKLLSQKVLPSLLKSKLNDSNLRVWVSGCSSGEEAYSIAMVLKECVNQLNQHVDIQIFATDIDEDAINRARLGTYPLSISADIDPTLLNRYFIKENEVYQIKKDVREMVVFAVQNIIKDPPFTKLDLICCRNLLIYLGSELQKKMMLLFHYSLKPEGILFLGSSESVGGLTGLFSAVERKWKIYKRKGDVLPLPQPGMKLPINLPISERLAIENNKDRLQSLSQLIEKKLLEEYALPSIIINEKGEILYVYGQTAKYLALPPGEAKLNNAFEMARDGLKLELPSAIRKTLAQKKKIVFEGLAIKNDNDSSFFNLIVKPLTVPEAIQGLLMVSFQQIVPVESLQSKPRSGKKNTQQIKVLEQELQHTRETLQTTIEELETSNEELKSANEEMQSTNEELQSTNEELETSKEEQNSLNEELVTVNNELQSKIDEFAKTASDMKNLLNSTEIPTIFLDRTLNISRFTSHATQVINLIHSDIGRPISDIVTHLKYENLVEDARAVLDSLISKQSEVQTRGGQWYSLKISPYRNLENVIDGVVITLNDISELRAINEKLQKEIEKRQQLSSEKKMLRNYLDSMINGVFITDLETHLQDVNEAYLKITGYRRDELIGQSILSLLVPEEEMAKGELLFQKLLRQDSLREQETLLLTKDKRRIPILYNATTTKDDQGNPTGLIGVVQDMAEHKQAEMNLKRLATIVQDSNDAVTVQDFEGNILSWNKGAQKMYGYSEEEALKMNIRDIIPHDRQKETLEFVKKISQGKVIPSFETQRQTKEGHMIKIWLTVTVLKDAQGNPETIATTERDITPENS